MNGPDRRDRGIGDWLRADAPSRAPDDLRASIHQAVRQSSQDRPSSLPGTGVGARGIGPRWLARGALAAAILVALAVALPRWVPDQGTGGHLPARSASPAPSVHSPSASPASSPEPTPNGSPVAGSLADLRFEPALRLAVPDGWLLSEDRTATLYLTPLDAGWVRMPDGSVAFDAVQLFRRPAAGPPDGGTDLVPGIGTTARQLAEYLRTRPQLNASPMESVTVDGRPGYQVDFSLSSSAGVMCGVACVNLLNDGDGETDYQFGVLAPWRTRAILVDAPDGSAVLIALIDADGEDFERFLAEAKPIVDSIRFDSASTPSAGA